MPIRVGVLTRSWSGVHLLYTNGSRATFNWLNHLPLVRYAPRVTLPNGRAVPPEATLPWNPFTTLRRSLRRFRAAPGPRPATMMGILLLGCVVANAAGAVVVVSEFGTAPRRAATAPSHSKAVPLRVPSRATHPPLTPADEAVSRTSGLRPPDGWTRLPTTPGLGMPGLVLPAGCPRQLPPSAAPFAVGSQDLGNGRELLRVIVLAYGAGLGGPAAKILTSAIASCPGRAGASPVPGTDGFVLPLPGLPAAGAALWRRGDVVVVLTGSGTDPARSMRTVIAPAVDAVLTTVLAGVCSDPASSVADATRNPLSARPRPFEVRTRVPSPPGVRWRALAPPAPAAVSLPAPMSHPDLAPLLPAPASRWLDTNNDGVADAPPPAAEAGRGEPPVFAAPEAFPRPSVAETAPAPAPPTAPQVPAPLLVSIPREDVTGPGCGWAFTGSRAASIDHLRIAAAAARARWQAVVESAAAECGYQVRLAAFVPQEAAWRTKQSRWLATQLVARARDDAERQAANARTTYTDSLRGYVSAPAPDIQPSVPANGTTTAPGAQQ